jgi:hypothetical protein
MFFIEMLLALTLSIVLSIALTKLFYRKGPGPLSGFLFFIIMLFLFIWAGGVWLAPIGTPAWGVYWAGFVVIGFFAALLIAALSPDSRDELDSAVSDLREADLQGPDVKRTVIIAGFSLIFWVIVALLLVAIISHYVVWLA